MDIKRVQDSDKFAIVLDEEELGKLKEIMKMDGLGMSYPFYINIREYLQRLEYEKSQRRSAQMSREDIARYMEPQDSTEWVSISAAAPYPVRYFQSYYNLVPDIREADD